MYFCILIENKHTYTRQKWAKNTLESGTAGVTQLFNFLQRDAESGLSLSLISVRFIKS
jgi:hypothetical protein